MSVQIDGERRAAVVIDGRQHDAVDQLADEGDRFGAVAFVVESLGQPGDVIAVVVRHLRMDQHAVVIVLGELGFEVRLAGFEFGHLVLDAGGGHAVHQRLDQPVKLALGLGQRGFGDLAVRVALAMQPVHVAGVFLAEQVAQRRVHQMMLQAFEHEGVEVFAAHGPAVVAGALGAGGRAADAMGIEVDVAAAARAAFHEAREQVARPAAVPVAGRLLAGAGAAQVCLPRLGRFPQRLIDDPQLRGLFDDPFGLRVEAGDALAGLRVLDVAQPVPDQPADIQLVVEDAGAAIRVAVDRARTPVRAGGARDGFAVERLGDGLRRRAGGVCGEDAPDDRGLLGVDLAFPAHRQAVGVEAPHHVIAVRVAAAGFAGLDTAAQAAARLVGEVLQEQRAHRALDADMQLVHVAFGEGDDPDAGEGGALVEMRDVFLVARQPVKSFGDDDVEFAGLRILQQHLDAGPYQARAGEAVIAVALIDPPAFALRPFLAQANLVLDRGVALQVR